MSSDILLVGLPRSGTSWVGSVLGSSRSIRYLREPITQAWLENGVGTPSIDPATCPTYAELADPILEAAGERRLIKEVNPYLAPYVAQKMTVVLLFRHPCAVALSYKERRWTRLDLERRFRLQETGDFWYDHGRFQALLLRPMLQAMSSKGIVVSYEDLTTDPDAGFAALADSIGLDWGEENRAYLASTLTERDRNDPYALTRDAEAARERWRDALTPDQQRSVLRGFRQYRTRRMPKIARRA